jgi:hypothetical protein
MTRRILRVIPTLDQGGLPTQLGMLTRGLSERGWEVHVAALGREGPAAKRLCEAGARVTAVGESGPSIRMRFGG